MRPGHDTVRSRSCPPSQDLHTTPQAARRPCPRARRLARALNVSSALLFLVIWAVCSVAGESQAPDGRATGTDGGDAAGMPPLVMLVDVYDTTFLVGSKYRCDPSCSRSRSGESDGGGDEEECAKDLNNDDVTRFGLGQRPEFGIVRDAGCPYPHLAGPARRPGANRVAAVVQTDFSLDVSFDGAGTRLLETSDVVEAGEALDYSTAVRAAWIIEPRHMFPPTYEQAVKLRAHYDVIFTHVRELTRQYPDTFRFCPFGTTYLRRWDHQVGVRAKRAM